MAGKYTDHEDDFVDGEEPEEGSNDDLPWEGPGEHDRRMMDDDYEETVACGRCGKQVWAHAQRCNHCGVYYKGEAWEFKVAGGKNRSAFPKWVVITAALTLILIGVLILLGLWWFGN